MSGAIRSMETKHQTILTLRNKVLVLGDAHVGKSALTQMFHKEGSSYPKEYIMTIGIDFCVKSVQIPNTNVQVELYIFDSAGQSVFNQREHGTKHWSNVSSLMLVYDVSDRESFRSIGKWLAAARSTRPTHALPGVLIANKIDLKESGRIAVSSDEGKEFAAANGLAYFESSAEMNIGVSEPFKFLANKYYNSYEENVGNVSLMRV